MLEKLLELLTSCWDRLSPAEVIDPYENGVVLRLGRYHRTLAPGFHWKWPLVEKVVQVLTCTTTMRLPPQTLTTKDDVGVVVAAIIKFQITKPDVYVTDIWDQHDVLADVTMGAVRIAISRLTYAELVASPPEAQVMELTRKDVNPFGFRVQKITFTDLGKVRSIRLIQPHQGNIAN